MVSSLAAISLRNSALPDQGFLEFFGVLAQNFDVPRPRQRQLCSGWLPVSSSARLNLENLQLLSAQVSQSFQATLLPRALANVFFRSGSPLGCRHHIFLDKPTVYTEIFSLYTLQVEVHYVPQNNIQV